jgi:hypothetical protein
LQTSTARNSDRRTKFGLLLRDHALAYPVEKAKTQVDKTWHRRHKNEKPLCYEKVSALGTNASIKNAPPRQRNCISDSQRRQEVQAKARKHKPLVLVIKLHRVLKLLVESKSQFFWR